jgi:hypothetical protein
MASDIKRGTSIRVRVQDDTKSRLDRLSKLYGIPVATMVSVWVGEALAKHENSLAMASKMADHVGGEVGKAIQQQLSMMPELFSGEAMPVKAA